MLKKAAVTALYGVVIAALLALMFLGAAQMQGAPVGKYLTF